jgi:hypothetical protein
MVYTPSNHPKQSFILVTSMVVVGILGGYYVNKYFMAVALIFWIQYTGIISYLQFKHGRKHSYKTFTDALLHPQLRFFIFEFIAFLGLGALLVFDSLSIGTAALVAWWLFSVNFYLYYKGKGVEE